MKTEPECAKQYRKKPRKTYELEYRYVGSVRSMRSGWSKSGRKYATAKARDKAMKFLSRTHAGLFEYRIPNTTEATDGRTTAR